MGDILGSAVNCILFKAIIKNKSFDFFSSLVLFGYIWVYLGIFGYIWVILGMAKHKQSVYIKMDKVENFIAMVSCLTISLERRTWSQIYP